MKYRVSAELLDEARKAKAWHDAKGGMRVARTPAIPPDVAEWLLRHHDW